MHLLGGLRDGEVFVVGNEGGEKIEGVAVVFGAGRDMKCVLPEILGWLNSLFTDNFKSGESPDWHAFLATLPSENRAWFESVRSSPLSPGDPNKVIEPVQHAIQQLHRAGLWTRSPARVVLSLDPRGESCFAGEGTGHGALPRSASEGELVQSIYLLRQTS